MPELPEVETMRRGLLPAVGSRIAEVQFRRSSLKPLPICPSRPRFRQRIVGRTIDRVERWGKRVVLVLDDQTGLLIQPKMTGIVLLTPPPDTAHLRVGFRLVGAFTGWLWYWDQRGLGRMAALRPDELAALIGPDRLGPDALEVPPGFWPAALGASRRPIKVALMDQRTVAGIGNLYASEILFRARIHPATPCRHLAPRHWQHLHGAVQQVLADAIAHEGSTLSDGTYRNALSRQGNYQHHHQVYARAGERCERCGRGIIRRIIQAQRSTFYCPVCQRG